MRLWVCETCGDCWEADNEPLRDRHGRVICLACFTRPRPVEDGVLVLGRPQYLT